MQEISSLPPNLPNGKTYFYGTCLFFGLILISIIGLFFYTQFLEHRILTLRDEIGVIDRDITAQNNDRTIRIANILNSNTIRPSIDLEGLVKKFHDLASDFGVRLQGFSVTQDVLSTKVIAITPDSVNHPDPISAILKMMRTPSFQGKSFTLEPITSIAGSISERSTPLQFRILSTITQ
jgi:hypothetical protein